MGHKRLAIEAGEDSVRNPIEYILESIKTIYSITHKTVPFVASMSILQLRRWKITVN